MQQTAIVRVWNPKPDSNTYPNAAVLHLIQMLRTGLHGLLLAWKSQSYDYVSKKCKIALINKSRSPACIRLNYSFAAGSNPW